MGAENVSIALSAFLKFNVWEYFVYTALNYLHAVPEEARGRITSFRTGVQSFVL